jgi:hypothetical protein
MFKKQDYLTLEEIDGKILSQDRWIFFLIILGMAAILVTMMEIDKVNTEARKSQEKVSPLAEFSPQKNQERKLLVLNHDY